MKFLTTIIILFLFKPASGQTTVCKCDLDTSMNNTLKCKTTILKNKAKLYWQFNCEKVWLTLETEGGRKITINEIPADLYGYKYRLGFHLIKEYTNNLLFRSGCPANGPCIYTLIDKSTGKKIKEFGQLICIDTHITTGQRYAYDFVVYFTKDYNQLAVYNIETKKIYKAPFDDTEMSSISEHQFSQMELAGNILTLSYENSRNEKKQVRIFLQDKNEH